MVMPLNYAIALFNSQILTPCCVQGIVLIDIGITKMNKTEFQASRALHFSKTHKVKVLVTQ